MSKNSTSEIRVDIENPLNLSGRKQNELDHSRIMPIGKVTDQPTLIDIHGKSSIKKGSKLRRSINSNINFFGLLLAICLLPLIVIFAKQQISLLSKQINEDTDSIMTRFQEAATLALADDYKTAEAKLAELQIETEALLAQFGFLQDYNDLKKNLREAVNLIGRSIKIVERSKQLPQRYLTVNQNPDKEQTEQLSNEIESLLAETEQVNQRLAEILDELRSKRTVKILTKYGRDKDKYTKLLNGLESIGIKAEKSLQVAKKMLGVDYPHRYLVLLQNSNELRPGGGFIGSFLIVDVNDGLIEKIEPHDVYSFDGQLPTLELGPQEIAPVNPYLAIRDSNTFPSFPDNAKKFLELLEKANGPSVDTVIAVNSSAFASFLEVSGPVKLNDGQYLKADNFPLIFTYLIESDSAQGNYNISPKEFMFSLVPQLKSHLLNFLQQDWGSAYTVLQQEISRKNIQAYSKDDELQSLFDQLSLTNMVSTPNTFDELLVTQTSISGNKSDRYLKTRYSHNTSISDEGVVTNSLTIHAYHGYNDQIESTFLNILRPFGVTEVADELRYVLGRGDNKTRFKIYVPKGSKLVNTRSVGEESIQIKKAHDLDDRTLITTVIELTPGEKKSITVDYELADKLEFNGIGLYDLTVHKASGIDNTKLEKTYKIDPSLSLLKSSPYVPVMDELSSYFYSGILERDQVFQVLLRD